MSNKKTFQDYAEMAKGRNSKLISVSNEETPRQGSVTILCNTCGQTFTTSAHSYSNARTTGCPSCKAIKARSQNVPITRIEQHKKDKKRETLSKRLAKRDLYSNIRNVEGLRNYLKQENNAYSHFILFFRF